MDLASTAATALTAQIGQARSNFSVDAVKQNADAQQQTADLLEAATDNIPSSPVRGTNVNIKA